MDIETRLRALETRVQELEDVEHIREHFSKYGFNADLGRVEQYLDSWSEDGLYENSENVQIHGKTELEKLVASPAGVHKNELENRSQHLVANLVIRIEGNTAWAEGYSIVVRAAEGVTSIRSAAYNHWDFERSERGWLLVRRPRRVVGGADWGGNVIAHYVASASPRSGT